MLKFCFIILFTALLMLPGCDIIYKLETQEYENKNTDGTLKNTGSFTSKKSKRMDRYDYYIGWDYEYITYYKSGEIKTSYSSSYKTATYGRSCLENYNIIKEYDENGTLRVFHKDICDCKKSIHKEYNSKGKLMDKTVRKVKRF